MYLLFVTLILSQSPRTQTVGSAIRVAIHAPRVALRVVSDRISCACRLIITNAQQYIIISKRHTQQL
jgi:hypothetical protein